MSMNPQQAVQARHFDEVWKRESWTLPEYVRHDPRGRLLGPLPGQRVLDLGSGTGEWAVFLAMQGAEVLGTDISAESMRQMRTGARLNGVEERVCGVILDAHRLPFADASFTAIHGQFILHHLDLAACGPELCRVLRPGGVAVFCENSASNPLLMWARRHLVGRFGIPKWSVEGEYPLRGRDIDLLGRLFGTGTRHYFEFRFFVLFDEKLFRGRRVLGWLDPLVFRFLPWARRFGYTQWLRFERRSAAQSQG